MSSQSDQNLLLGILALQMDFVTRDALLTGMNAWLIQKNKPLAQVLVEQGALSVSHERLLLQVVDAHLVAHNNDVKQSLAASIRMTDLAGALRGIDDEELQDSLASFSMDGHASENATVIGGRSSLDGRFIVVRPHACGGLGEVSVAVDRELNREVALKLVREQFVDNAEVCSRFRMEAEVTGGLEHPGIVPVYGMGATAEGRPFYAMRFIRGESLQDSIRNYHGLPNGDTPARNLMFRDILRRFIDVCDAVAYAHSRGVLHRDLKPGNIMLGKYGETLVVDWGLARIRGQSEAGLTAAGSVLPLQVASESDVHPTQHGSIMGTLQYMSPEQAEGKLDQLGPTTDVYSMGAILYEILTGQPPIGKVPDADGRPNAAAMLQKVRDGDFQPAVVVNPSAQRPLSAVCSKATALRPEDRYSSVAELSRDLERWMADEPVSAFPDPLTVRARRWVRRNQALTVSIVAVAIVSAMGLAVFSKIISSKNSELRTANASERDARILAEGSAKAAREQSQLALNTLTSVITDIQRGLEGIPGGGEVRRRLLRTSLEKLESVSTQYLAQATVDQSTMLALHDMGNVVLTFGSDENQLNEMSAPESQSAVRLAESYYVRAFQIASSLAAADPRDFQKQRDLCNSYRYVGDVCLKLGRTQEAIVQFQAILAVFESLARDDPRDTKIQNSLSSSHGLLGDVLFRIGRTDEALEQYEDGLRISRALAEVESDNDLMQENLSFGYGQMGDVLLALGRLDESLAHFDEALKISLALAEADPSDARMQRNLSIAYERMGDVLLKLGRTEDAVAQFEADLKVAQSLAEADPRDTLKQCDLWVSNNKIGDVFLILGRTDEAITRFENGLRIARALAKADASDTQRQRDLSISYERLGDAFLKLGRMDEALAKYEDASKISHALAEADPLDGQMQRDLGVSCNRLGHVYLKLGRTDDALAQFEANLKVSRALVEADPIDSRKQRDLMGSHFSLGTTRLERDEFLLAAAEYDAAAEILRKMIERGMDTERSKLDLADAEHRAQSARLTETALGDWEQLVQRPSGELLDLLDIRGTQCCKRSRFADAVQAAAKLQESDNANSEQLYNAACVFSLCAAAIDSADGENVSPDRIAKRQEHIANAVAVLRQAISKGWTDFTHMRQDSDLAPLRDLPEFHALFPE